MFWQTYSHPLSRKRYGAWTWCFRCCYVHRTAEWFENHWFCPHPGCDGTARDSSRWRNKQEPPFDNHPEYPATPIEGRQYEWGRAA